MKNLIHAKPECINMRDHSLNVSHCQSKFVIPVGEPGPWGSGRQGRFVFQQPHRHGFFHSVDAQKTGAGNAASAVPVPAFCARRISEKTLCLSLFFFISAPKPLSLSYISDLGIQMILNRLLKNRPFLPSWPPGLPD